MRMLKFGAVIACLLCGFLLSTTALVRAEDAAAPMNGDYVSQNMVNGTTDTDDTAVTDNSVTTNQAASAAGSNAF